MICRSELVIRLSTPSPRPLWMGLCFERFPELKALRIKRCTQFRLSNSRLKVWIDQPDFIINKVNLSQPWRCNNFADLAHQIPQLPFFPQGLFIR